MPKFVSTKQEQFWKDKTVFLTGHTGFKGSWLAIWLIKMGAQVTGYSLDPPTDPSLFQLADIGASLNSIIADVRDLPSLQRALLDAKPEIVLHMAAQSLVRSSYKEPVETYATNVMGTVNLLEAVRSVPEVRAVVIVTTDKCYENRELGHPFREDEPLGGKDPYSSSKACTELVTSAWRDSFFNAQSYGHHRVAIATARAGNVIGGGDWAEDRLLPDFFRAVAAVEPVRVRNPHAVRPWQHVLEPVSGYLRLAQMLYEQGSAYAESWNFGPDERDAWPVADIMTYLCQKWGENSRIEFDHGEHPHEAGYLRLDSSKVRTRLGWKPCWTVKQALDSTIDWVRQWQSGGDPLDITLSQIERYEACQSEI